MEIFNNFMNSIREPLVVLDPDLKVIKAKIIIIKPTDAANGA